MQDLAFADATRPAPVCILRLPMLEYSIGHELLLQAQRNPLVVSDGGDSRTAIIRAALICSNSWEQNHKPQRWMRLWGWMIRNEDFAFAAADFQNYRRAGSSFPRITAQDKEGRAFGSPLLCRLLNFVNGDYDYPLGLAQWRYFAAMEDEGRVQVENELEQSAREQIDKHVSDILREQAERKGATCLL